MNVDEGIFASWSELALQDLLIDVAAVVDATDSTEPRTSLVDLIEPWSSARSVRQRE
jgi:hypothetical protein